MREETDLFRLAGVPYTPPEARIWPRPLQNSQG
jgi:hypothetical protein